MNLVHYDTRAEWLAARGKTVGGSDAPVILGLSPYRAPLALWTEKVGLVARSDEDNQRLRIGHHIEGGILGMLAEEAGVYVEPVRFGLATHPEFPELTYSPDGIVYDKDFDERIIGSCDKGHPIGCRGLAEVKNRAGFDAADDWTGEIPRDVYAQVQHGLDVCQLERAWVGVLLSGREFRWAKVERDPLWIADNRPALLDFARRVREEDPPPPTGHEGDRAAIVARFPTVVEGKVAPLSGEAVDLAYKWRDANSSAKAAKLVADECANRLAVMLGDSEVGYLPSDLGKVTFKWVDVKARVQDAYRFRAPRVYLKGE